jgi:hypothetical protein
MTKISQYPEIASPDADDLLIGTDVENSSNATKNFTIQSIIDLVPGGTGVISTSANKTMYSTNPAAGVPSVGLSDSIFLGYRAGSTATNAAYSNFIGNEAGFQASSATYSNFLGNGAGWSATNARDSNFFGAGAGYQATSAEYSNFIGLRAGAYATTAEYSNFLGFEAGKDSTGNNVNAFGSSAGKDNTLSGQTIFSNSSLPSYTDRAAAVAAITVLLGASAGDTYLYYNQTTFGIEAVRL